MQTIEEEMEIDEKIINKQRRLVERKRSETLSKYTKADFHVKLRFFKFNLRFLNIIARVNVTEDTWKF